MAGAPLLITAELPPDILAWADGLRRRHYPPERNRLRAHVTLFHALPPSAEAEVRRLLADCAAANPPPEARIEGIWDMGTGTALDIRCAALAAFHRELSERLHGLLTKQDDRKLRPHITVQNKVGRGAAKALQAELADTLHPRSFRFRGFGLYAWEDALWNPIAEFPFRG
ncbi:MAG: 2'-5' RNA ligase family protein [Novosphingobium sp.]|nr:2'-5' RNA ligase family protein [Novosphingobium sp.]